MKDFQPTGQTKLGKIASNRKQSLIKGDANHALARKADLMK